METNWGSALGVCAPEHLLQLDKRDLAHLYRQLGAPPPPPPLDEAAGGGRRPPPDLCRRFETMLLSCRLTPAVAVVDSLARVSSAPEKRAQVGVDTIDTHTHTHTDSHTHMSIIGATALAGILLPVASVLGTTMRKQKRRCRRRRRGCRRPPPSCNASGRTSATVYGAPRR
jgi:hypothetical protein